MRTSFASTGLLVMFLSACGGGSPTAPAVSGAAEPQNAPLNGSVPEQQEDQASPVPASDAACSAGWLRSSSPSRTCDLVATSAHDDQEYCFAASNRHLVNNCAGCLCAFSVARVPTGHDGPSACVCQHGNGGINE